MRAFLHFTQPGKRVVFWLAVASLLSVGAYILASALYYRYGFPLDDAWIHLTFARNLVEHGEWAFQPGRPSAGSTSPLWTAWLSIGFPLGLAPYIWTYFLGALLLFGTALLGEMIVRQLVPTYQPVIPWAGLFFIIEWHLVWAAASGMETMLHALLIMSVLGMLMSHTRRFMTLGLLVGFSVWVRPDGITLLGPVAVYALLYQGGGVRRWRALYAFLFGTMVLFVPYLLFNLTLSGTPMPNTFYAKQAEYSAWQALPFVSRFVRLALQFFSGPSLALLPGALLWLTLAMRRRDWGTVVGLVWLAGYLFIYISRLPVYQHGRYVIPGMPIFFLWGLLGLFTCMRQERTNKYHWSLLTGWRLFILGISGAFWLFGARAYAQDVALIESEMVETAKWVSENIPGGELIAAHDIGALGFFDTHPILDLAGLVSPEVIPILRDEDQLLMYLESNDVNYLIAFPDFYPLLSKLSSPVFITNGSIAPLLGGENMVVFRLP